MRWLKMSLTTFYKQPNAMNKKICLLIAVSLISTFSAHATDLSDKLKSPNHVLLMRHATAPGVGDPANYSLSDCKSQRNLSAEGRSQAKTVGVWLRKQGVSKAEVYSSAWCRCKDTAELLDFGGFTVEPSLASFFDEMQKAKESTQQAQQFIAQKLKVKGEKALILVTHHVNIFELMGENIGSGDMVLMKVDAAGKMVSYKLYPRPD
jgi:phosphohistidine phosphatase SixA